MASHLTQHQLVDQAGVSRAWLARVEKGHRKAELELVMRTLAVLGLAFRLGPTPANEPIDPELAEALQIAGQT